MARKSDPTDRTLDMQQRELERAARPAPVAPGTDRTGMPEMHGAGGLADLERITLRKLNPLRDRWQDITAFNVRVAELELHQQAVTNQIREAGDGLRTASTADADALAQWQLDGAKGKRPEPTLPILEERLAELQRDYDALTVAVGKVLAEKEQYVVKHRSRLVKQAGKDTEAAHRRYLDAVSEAEKARAELHGARSDALWAATYPAPEAGRQPPELLAGGLRRVLERFGVNVQLPAAKVFELLREDGTWLRDAISDQQRAVIEGRNPRAGNAGWAGGTGRDGQPVPPDPEMAKQLQEEKQQQINRYLSGQASSPYVNR
jgi:hypothetical protein